MRGNLVTVWVPVTKTGLWIPVRDGWRHHGDWCRHSIQESEIDNDQMNCFKQGWFNYV